MSVGAWVLQCMCGPTSWLSVLFFRGRTWGFKSQGQACMERYFYIILIIFLLKLTMVSILSHSF